ncbi:hypothetical protein OAE77_00580 [bacterium]|nr:hypothetical protein [bacterium]
MKLNEMFVSESQSASEFIAKHTGRYFLFNVEKSGRRIATCVNIKESGAGRCRFLDKNVSASVSSDDPGFELTPETIYMSYAMLNTLANCFEAVRRVIPDAAFNAKGKVSVGLLKRDSEEMGRLLGTIQENTATIRTICDSLDTKIDTPIYSLRKATKKPVKLSGDSRLTSDGKSLLEAYTASLPIYSSLPELCSFGNENTNRGKDEPTKRDAGLRFWMEYQQKKCIENPLRSKHGLNFVAHEIKPLNIAGRDMRWNCIGNPRTDSIDLLLEYEGGPVITEVKMAGDKFLSVGAVQLWYYAAVLASDSQKNRLGRCFDEIGVEKKPWLGLLAEARDENKSNERGFSADLDSVLFFLRNSETKRVMGQQFAGAFVLVVEEDGDGFAISDEVDVRIDW